MERKETVGAEALVLGKRECATRWEMPSSTVRAIRDGVVRKETVGAEALVLGVRECATRSEMPSSTVRAIETEW